MNRVDTKDKKQVALGVNWHEICLILISFMFARVGFEGSFYTAGIAYIGSLYVTKSMRYFGPLVAILGILSVGDFNIRVLKYILMITIIMLIRKFIEESQKSFNIRNQMVSVFVSTLLVNLVCTVILGRTLYAIAIGVVEAIVAAALTYIFYCGIEVLKEQRDTPLTNKEGISVILMFAVLIAGLVDFYIRVPLCKEIYFRDILTYIVLIGVIYLGGMNIGVTISMVMSSLLVIIGYIEPVFVAIYGMAALMGGLFLTLGRCGVILGGAVGQILGCMLFNGGQIDLSLLGAYLIASLISMILPKHYFGLAGWFGEKSREQNEQLHLERVQRIMTSRLKHIVGGFEKLGDSFQKTDLKKTDFTQKDVKRIIEETGEKMCIDCSMRRFCWEQDINTTYKHAQEMMNIFEKKGFIAEGEIPALFKAHCPNAVNFAYVMSFKMDLLRQEMAWHNRFIENRALIAQQLKAVAVTLKNLVQEVEKEIYFNKEEEKLLRESLLAAGIKLTDIMILENKGKIQSIELYTSLEQRDYKDLMEQIIEDTLGYRVTLDSCTYQKNNYEYKWRTKNTYRITSGYAVSAKEEISGDVYTFMEVEDDQYLLALADGMGSGRVAYEESAATIGMLEDFMDSGFRKDLAVKMINSALILNEKSEVFSTIDVTLIDRKSGIAEFLKAGAATSFILHKNEVIPIRMSTLPIGIVKDVDLEIKRVQLEDGDIVIMITDGILEASGDEVGKEETFKHFILECKGQAPQYMADYLMQKSKDLLGVMPGDDMTIVVARIWQEY